VLKAHRLLYHSTLGLRAMKKKKDPNPRWHRRRHLPGRAALEATHGQMDGFFSQPPYTCHQNQVASLGD